MKNLNNNQGSVMVFAVMIMAVLSIVVAGFLSSALGYSTQVAYDRVEKQSYLTARSVAETLGELITQQDASVSYLTNKMTPPNPLEGQDLEAYIAYRDAAEWDVIDLGEVTFEGNPLEMGTATATLTMISWSEYQLSVTATLGDEVETVNLRIGAVHEQEENTVVTPVIPEITVPTDPEPDPDPDPQPEPDPEPDVTLPELSIPANTPRFYLDYSPAFTSVNNLRLGNSPLTIGNWFVYGNNLTTTAPVYSTQDIVLHGSAGNLAGSAQLVSTNGIVLSGQSYSGSLIQAGGTVELLSNTTVNTTIYCDTLSLEGENITIADGCIVQANTLIVQGTNISVRGSVSVNSVVVTSSSPSSVSLTGVSTLTGTASVNGETVTEHNGVSFGTQGGIGIASPSIPSRTVPTWANYTSSQVREVNADTDIVQGGYLDGQYFYYHFQNSGTLSHAFTPSNTINCTPYSPIVIVVRANETLIITSKIVHTDIYFVLEGNANLVLMQGGSARVYAHTSSVASSLNATMNSLFYANPASATNFTILTAAMQSHLTSDLYGSQTASLTLGGRLYGSFDVPMVQPAVFTSTLELQLAEYGVFDSGAYIGALPDFMVGETGGGTVTPPTTGGDTGSSGSSGNTGNTGNTGGSGDSSGSGSTVVRPDATVILPGNLLGSTFTLVAYF